MDLFEPLYKPFRSTHKHKKYSVYVLQDGRRRLLHFGDRYRDEVSLKLYLVRIKGIKNKMGEYAYKDKNSRLYWNYKLGTNQL